MATTTGSDSKVGPTTHHREKHVSTIGTLGNLRLRDLETNEIILVPTPSADPYDPLNWYVSLSGNWRINAEHSTGQEASSTTPR